MKYNRQKTQYKRKMVGFYDELEIAQKKATELGLSFSAFIRQAIRVFNNKN